MICSQNEITNLLFKACVGAGVDVGLAADFAKAGTHLCAQGLDGVDIVLNSVSSENQNSGAVLAWPAAIEIAMASGVSQACTGSHGAEELLSALCHVASSCYEMKFDVVTQGGELFVSCGGSRAGGVTPQGGALVVSDESISRASKLAHLTYVPASEESRLGGAGAGLLDND